MTEEELLYRKADTLSHDGLAKFLKANNMDEDKYMAHRIRLLAQQPKPKVSRAARAKILKSQGNRCAMCRDPIPHGCEACYDKTRDDILCRRCTLGLANIRSMVKAGITWEAIVERLSLQDGDRDVFKK